MAGIGHFVGFSSVPVNKTIFLVFNGILLCTNLFLQYRSDHEEESCTVFATSDFPKENEEISRFVENVGMNGREWT